MGSGVGSPGAVKAIVRDVQTWSVFSERKGYAFNGYAVSTEEGTLLIDPPDAGEDGWLTVDLLEPFAGVWLTNRNHSRAAAAFRERYGLSVWAHEADADRLEVGADETVAAPQPSRVRWRSCPCTASRQGRLPSTSHAVAR
jgi:Metallo-beta-lactamase superfamily